MAYQKKRPFIFYVGISAIAILLVSRFFFFAPGYLEEASSMIMYPVLVMQNRFIAPLYAWREQKKTVAELEAIIQKERDQKDLLLAENIKLNALMAYADEVKELLAFKESYQAEQAYITQIIFKSFSDQSHHFLIDKGSDHGIEPDMVAVYAQCLVGRVVEVYPYYSKIALLSDRQCNVAAYCELTRSTGIYEGCNNLEEGALSFVSHLSVVEENDLVVSSGEGLVFPQGFGLGRIKNHAIDGLYQKVVIEPLIDMRRLQYCMIIKKGDLHQKQDGAEDSSASMPLAAQDTGVQRYHTARS